MKSKVLEGINLDYWLENTRDFGLPIIMTNGCFDVFHIGHMKLLSFCGSLSNEMVGAVIVAINSDRSVKQLKGNSRPIFSLNERIELLEGVSYVDKIVVFDNESVLETVKYINPDILVKGSDCKVVIGREHVEQNGGKVVMAPLVDNVSSTKIISMM